MTYFETPQQTDTRHAAEAQDSLVARLRRQIAVLEQANLNLIEERDRLKALTERYRDALCGRVE